MCTYIAAMLPPGADAARIRALADAKGFGWQELSNRHLRGQVATGARWFLTMRKHCDCGTVLGSAASGSRGSSGDPETQVPTLRSRGWSEAKIGRWLAAKRAAAARRQEARTRLPIGSTPEAASWMQFLRSSLSSGSTPRVGVLVHEYARSVEGKRVTIRRREPQPAAQVTCASLCRMERDVLYEFTR